MDRYEMTKKLATGFIDHYETLDHHGQTYYVARTAREWLHENGFRGNNPVMSLVAKLESLGTEEGTLMAHRIMRSAVTELEDLSNDVKKAKRAFGTVLDFFGSELIESIDIARGE